MTPTGGAATTTTSTTPADTTQPVTTTVTVVQTTTVAITVTTTVVHVTTPNPSSIGRTVLLRKRTKASDCTLGPQPDRRCSPGAYYSGHTKTVLCSKSFHTGTVRNVPDSMKHQVETEPGLTPKPYGRTLEIDHIISLELGGSNDIANLFPEPGSGRANYHAKDKLENRLHAMVCAGQIGLRSAQNQIASN